MEKTMGTDGEGDDGRGEAATKTGETRLGREKQTKDGRALKSRR